jgi:hypothetical protein
VLALLTLRRRVNGTPILQPLIVANSELLLSPILQPLIVANGELLLSPGMMRKQSLSTWLLRSSARWLCAAAVCCCKRCSSS